METKQEPNKFTKLSDLLGKVISRYDSYSDSIVSQIEVIEKSLSGCLQSSETKPESEILEDLSTELLNKRPLSKMEENSKNFYKYISKLGKDIDKLQQVRARDLHLYDIDFDHKSLKETIGEYLLHQVLQHKNSPKNVTRLKQIVEELGLINHRELTRRFDLMCSIKAVLEGLDQKDLAPLRKWISKNGFRLRKENSTLGYKYLVLRSYQNLFELGKTVNETLGDLKSETKIIAHTKKKALQKLFGSLVFLKQHDRASSGPIWNEKVLKNEAVVELLSNRYGWASGG